MAKKNTVTTKAAAPEDSASEAKASETPKAEAAALTPMQTLKLREFKKHFPQECAWLIQEFKAANGL